MRAWISIVVRAAGVAALALGWTGSFATPHATRFADNSPGAIAVDAELVIAVDVSNSMDPEEQALQREGYITGLTSREFLSALRSGINGRIAVTYFEWAGPLDQKIIIPWRLIDGPDAADAVAKEIAAAPYRRAPRTSIYGALKFAKPLFDLSGYRGLRRIIDVSGDGTNNTGPPVTLMRDEVLANQQILPPCPESRKENLLLKACRQGRRARTTHSRTQPNAARVAPWAASTGTRAR